MINDIDTSLLLAINGWRSAWADTFMYLYSGKFVWVPLYVASAFVLWRNLGWRKALYAILAIALTITLADQFTASVLRPLFCRMRPSNPANPISAYVQLVNGRRGGSYGFPSCHAANTFGLAIFLCYALRHRLVTTFMILWAVLTCYSRSYLGVHYPGDLLAGAVIGTGAATLLYFLLVRLTCYQPPRPVRMAWLIPAVGTLIIAILLVYSLC